VTPSSARALAHGAWILTVLLLLGSVGFGLVFADVPVVEAPAGIAFAMFSIMGAVVALREPSNAIGWIFCALGTLFATGSILDMYAVSMPPLPGRAWAALGAACIWFPAVALLMQVMLRFPSGSHISRPWARVGRIGFAGAAVAALGTALTPGEFPDYPIENPWGVAWIGGSILENGGVAWAGILVGLVGGAIALVVRFRRSTGITRAQLKWFVYASALLGVSAVLNGIFLTEMEGGVVLAGSVMTAVSIGLFILSLCALPVAAAIAILRYRLYDIDVVINRSLVYATLTVVLGATYVAIVTAASTVAGDSSVTVAAATLIVAGLFRPLRRGIQRLIDRRFYRMRYDAQRTVSDFGLSLRNEIELDALSSELVRVVDMTLRPVAVSVWLRSPERRSE
jgi:hypothetical protein